MKLRQADFLLVPLAFFVTTIAETHAASQSWHPESVAAREIELAKEFAEKGLKLGSPVFLRVYKQTSEMELWVLRGPRYVHFKTYGICRWSGGLGPKFYEGDRQSPEGLYRITASDLIVNPRWDRAMNINYPNNFDHLNGRGGSGILIHGGCGSIGCFAIQNENVEEVYGAVRAALRDGQAYVPVLALPFRYSALAPEKEDTLYMSEFWGDLRRADLLFERDKLPPVAWICDGRYLFSDRRGDRRRHAVHLPGCRPLNGPSGTRAAKSRPGPQTPAVEAAPEAPQQAVTVTPLHAAVSQQEAVEQGTQAGGRPSAVRRMAWTGGLKALRGGTKHMADSRLAAHPTEYPRLRTFEALHQRRARVAGWKSKILLVRQPPTRAGGRRLQFRAGEASGRLLQASM